MKLIDWAPHGPLNPAGDCGPCVIPSTHASVSEVTTWATPSGIFAQASASSATGLIVI
jgi:hypothetical protein